MKKKEIFMISTVSFSAGIVFGFFISPIKKGIYNIAGNTRNYYYHDEKQSSESQSEE